jgi:hypothetical protein
VRYVNATDYELGTVWLTGIDYLKVSIFRDRQL